MAGIHPIEIDGNWVSGFALDYHTISSACIGYDDYGHPMFETEYSEIGGLLYRLKSQKDKSVIPEIVETAALFVGNAWKPQFSIIVPVPASSARAEQPVILLATALSERLAVPMRPAAVTKTRMTEQLKNVHDYAERIRILDEAFSSDPSIVSDKKVLLFDDLYRSGATITSVANVLRTQGNATAIYVLTVTKTRVNR